MNNGEEHTMSGNWYSNFKCADLIICPYCGKRYEPTYDSTLIGNESVDCYKEGELGEFTCDECGKRFTLFAEMKYIYTTETLDGEMTDEEYYGFEDK